MQAFTERARSYEREDVVFDPVHYLPLIEKKINALDQAAPLTGWELPPEFATLRRLMEARMLKAGRREFVQQQGGQHFAPISGQCSIPIDTHRSASTV